MKPMAQAACRNVTIVRRSALKGAIGDKMDWTVPGLFEGNWIDPWSVAGAFRDLADFSLLFSVNNYITPSDTTAAWQCFVW